MTIQNQQLKARVDSKPHPNPHRVPAPGNKDSQLTGIGYHGPIAAAVDCERRAGW